MLAKNALALRRATPLGHRCMSALLSNVDELTAKVASNPELYKLIESKIIEADKPGVRATVDAPKAPHSCKYTEEGSVAYYVVKHIAQVDRRMKMLAEVEVTPTAAETAQWTADAEKWSEEQMKAGQPAAAAH